MLHREIAETIGDRVVRAAFKDAAESGENAVNLIVRRVGNEVWIDRVPLNNPEGSLANFYRSFRVVESCDDDFDAIMLRIALEEYIVTNIFMANEYYTSKVNGVEARYDASNSYSTKVSLMLGFV